MQSVRKVPSIAAHGAIGCVGAEIQGGSCADGARSGAVGKLVTLGTADIAQHFKLQEGSYGQMMLSVGIGCAAAGGDPEDCASRVATAFAENAMGNSQDPAYGTPMRDHCTGSELCETIVGGTIVGGCGGGWVVLPKKTGV